MTNIVRKKYAEKGEKKRSTVRSDGEDIAPKAPTEFAQTDRQAGKHSNTQNADGQTQCPRPVHGALKEVSLCSKFSAGVPSVMAALDRYRII